MVSLLLNFNTSISRKKLSNVLRTIMKAFWIISVTLVVSVYGRPAIEGADPGKDPIFYAVGAPSCHKGNFDCILPDYDDPTAFYQCVSGCAVAVKQFCAECLHFDFYKQRCEWPNEAAQHPPAPALCSMLNGTITTTSAPPTTTSTTTLQPSTESSTTTTASSTTTSGPTTDPPEEITGEESSPTDEPSTPTVTSTTTTPTGSPTPTDPTTTASTTTPTTTTGGNVPTAPTVPPTAPTVTPTSP